MEDKEFFYFGVKKAFKPFAYDIEEIDESSFAQGCYEYTVKSYYGRGKRAGNYFTPELEIYKNNSVLDKLEINGLSFSARTSGDWHDKSYKEVSWIQVDMEYFDEEDNYCKYEIEKEYDSSLRTAVELYFYFILYFSNFKNINCFEAYERLKETSFYSGFSTDKASSFLKDIKLLFQFTKKENIDPSFVRLIKNEIESRFEDFKQAMNGKSLESMMC